MPNPPLGRRAPVVAIDGPAGAGKSTVARAVAAALGYGYLDTGAMYRAVALRALETGTPLDRAGALARIATGMDFDHDHRGVLIDGARPSRKLRSRRVSEASSRISAHPGVRRAMVAAQRRILRGGGMVAEGRDIGTVVYPAAEVKIFLTASVAERARRRHLELTEAGHEVAPAVLRAEIEERDRRDSTRERSPLRRADDAVEVDTTRLTPERVIARIVALARAAEEAR